MASNNNAIAPAASKNRDVFPFFNLAGELRDMIYDEVLNVGEERQAASDLKTATTGIAPVNHLLVNHQFNEELQKRAKAKNRTTFTIVSQRDIDYDASLSIQVPKQHLDQVTFKLFIPYDPEPLYLEDEPDEEVYRLGGVVREVLSLATSVGRADVRIDYQEPRRYDDISWDIDEVSWPGIVRNSKTGSLSLYLDQHNYYSDMDEDLSATRSWNFRADDTPRLIWSEEKHNMVEVFKEDVPVTCRRDFDYAWNHGPDMESWICKGCENTILDCFVDLGPCKFRDGNNLHFVEPIEVYTQRKQQEEAMKIQEAFGQSDARVAEVQEEEDMEDLEWGEFSRLSLSFELFSYPDVSTSVEDFGRTLDALEDAIRLDKLRFDSIQARLEQHERRLIKLEQRERELREELNEVARRVETLGVRSK